MSHEVSHYESVPGCPSSPLMWLFIFLTLIVGVAFFFGVRSLGMLVRRRWRTGLINLGVGVGLVAVTVVGSVLFGGLVLDAVVDVAPPDQKARYLAESISCGMNCGFLALPLGVVLGLLDCFWWQRKRPEGGHTRSQQR